MKDEGLLTDQRIRELIAMRAELAGIITVWDERLIATPDGQPALLLAGSTDEQLRNNSAGQKLRRRPVKRSPD